MDELTATDLKSQLKKWENEFYKEHGRKPSKDDISESGQEIQEKYKKYNTLKRTLQKVEVWGAELNREVEKEVKEAEKEEEKRPSFRIGQKLWESAKSASASKARPKTGSFKRLSLPFAKDENLSAGPVNGPRLSLGGKWVKEDTPRPQVVKSRLPPSTAPPPPPPSFTSPELKAPKPSPKAARTDDDLVMQPKKGSMFEKALRLTQSSKKPPRTIPTPTDDVYVPVVNKSQLSSFKNLDADFLDQVKESFENEMEDMDVQSKSDNYPSPVKHKSPITQSKPPNNHKSPVENRTLNKDPISTSLGEKDTSKTPATTSHTSNTSETHSSRRGSKRKISDSPSSNSHIADEFGFDDWDDPFVDPQDSHPEPRASKKPRTEATSRVGSLLKEGNVTPQPAQPSPRPPIGMSIIRDGNVERTQDSSVTTAGTEDKEDVNEEEEAPKPKKGKAKKFGPSTSVGGGGGGGGGGKGGGGLNTNFVRLNMKVKSYRRRGGGRTGGQMKRLQWKQKMAARASSRGSGCFKCGQEGHWAKNCKGVKNKNTEPVEDESGPPEDFPSLGDALRMAHGRPNTKAKEKASTDSQGTPKAEDGDVKGPEEPGSNSETPATEGAETPEDWLEELELVRQRQSERDPESVRPPTTRPLFELTPDGQLPETPASVYKALKTFGYSTFRPGQESAVMRILCGQTTLVQLATGAGKSLCYQLPALMYAQRATCLTLVISPLVSLMEDQVTGLPAGLSGACLHTNMTKPQREKVASAVQAGEVHFLLLSPEALISTGSGLLNFSKLPPIAFACIDEAHCVSAWSHNFRPSYLRVCKVLREKLGVGCLLGLTATATRATALNVAEHIGVTDGENAFIRGTVIPDNLVLSVSRDMDRDRALLEILQGDRFATCHSIIIYCTRRETTERLAAMIRTNLKDTKHTIKINKDAPKSKSKKIIPSAEAYHAGLSAAARKRVQLNFMNGSLRIVAATVAFGMGLDKQDVHGIIHYNLPRNFESYVQEIGRAGRDGFTSHCHVFLNESGTDLFELKRHIYADTVERLTVKKLIQRFFPRCRCEELQKRFQNIEEDEETMGKSSESACPGHEKAVVIESLIKELDMKEEGISTLLCYLELDESRMLEILSPVYATCSITSHSGREAFTAGTKTCPALAVALAQAKMRGESFDGRHFSFPVVDVADSLGASTGIVKREISALKWKQTGIGGYQRTSLIIEYSDLAYRVRSRGNLTDEETDHLVDLLHGRITAQEENELQHLHYFYNVLHSVAHKNYYMCADKPDLDRSDRLKVTIRQYFDFNQIHLPQDKASSVQNRIEQPEFNEEMVCSDVRQFVHLYAEEHALTARCITRIFHGIGSPNFPAEVWGRVRRFWRCELQVDFNTLLRLTKRTLISLK